MVTIAACEGVQHQSHNPKQAGEAGYGALLIEGKDQLAVAWS